MDRLQSYAKYDTGRAGDMPHLCEYVARWPRDARAPRPLGHPPLVRAVCGGRRAQRSCAKRNRRKSANLAGARAGCPGGRAGEWGGGGVGAPAGRCARGGVREQERRSPGNERCWGR